MATLTEILARYPAGSDERLAALGAWRQEEDRLLGAARQETVKAKPRLPERAKAQHVETTAVPVSDEARREWGRRREAAEQATEQAASLRARVNHAVELTCARVSAVADPQFRQAKMARLAEIQASLATKDPKTLAVISRTLGEIEARLSQSDD